MRTIKAGRTHPSSGVFRQAGSWGLALLFFVPLVLALPGCSGCNKDPATLQAEKEKEEAERKKKEAEKPKPDFEIRGLSTIPTSHRMQVNSCKPGHWTGAVLEDVKANNFDFLGEMDIDVEDDKSPLPLMATPFELTTSRPIVLPKGQTKLLDSILFVPQNAQKSKAICKVNGRGGGRTAMETPLLLTRMPSFQYHLVVLARIPEQYLYLDGDRFFCVKPYLKTDMDNGFDRFYRISFLNGEKRPALPGHAMLWTSIACIVWDDASPIGFDVEQQHALLDWLHWGGQIIMSGPDSLDSLKDSFLEPYLPATAVGSREIVEDDLDEINRFSGKSNLKLKPVKPWSGVKLEKHPEAAFVPNSGELLVERRVGRGRIIVSAFRLTGRDFTTWQGTDEFFNAYLLRRPARQFLETDEADQVIALRKDGHTNKDWDAAEVTPLRYFARDEGIVLHDYGPDQPKPAPTIPSNYNNYGYNPYPSMDEAPDLKDTSSIKGPGVAAWNDFSPSAQAARSELNAAARIEVPKRSFIVMVLVLYLAFLVPFNWCLFRAIGRVEWAWAAAPVIAIICTGLVIKLAQLDIGFVRSRNEIGLLEIQPNYARAHLTRYNALYTSLSTPYDFTFEDNGAKALPFPTVREPGSFTMVSGQERRNLRYVYGEEAMLQGVPVTSNSTSLMHSEEVFDLGGKLFLKENAFGSQQLVNQTKLKLQGVGLIRKEPSGNLQTAWLTVLESGDMKTVDWVRESGALAGDKLWTEFRDRDPLTFARTKAGELNLRDLVNFAEKSEDMRPGEIKLVAWTDEELPGLTISPSSAQSRHAAVVVAHLAYGEAAAPEPDANLPSAPRKPKERVEKN